MFLLMNKSFELQNGSQTTTIHSSTTLHAKQNKFIPQNWVLRLKGVREFPSRKKQRKKQEITPPEEPPIHQYNIATTQTSGKREHQSNNANSSCIKTNGAAHR